MSIFTILFTAALVNNFVLSQFMGICPFLGVSKKVETAAGMGGAVIFVITIASLCTSTLYNLLLKPNDLEYLNTIVFILVIAALVQFVEMVLKKNDAGAVSVTRCVSSADYYELCGTWCCTVERPERVWNFRKYDKRTGSFRRILSRNLSDGGNP